MCLPNGCARARLRAQGTLGPLALLAPAYAVSRVDPSAIAAAAAVGAVAPAVTGVQRVGARASEQGVAAVAAGHRVVSPAPAQAGAARAPRGDLRPALAQE